VPTRRSTFPFASMKLANDRDGWVMAGRGHALTIDAGWREVARKSLEFVNGSREPVLIE